MILLETTSIQATIAAFKALCDQYNMGWGVVRRSYGIADSFCIVLDSYNYIDVEYRIDGIVYSHEELKEFLPCNY